MPYHDQILPKDALERFKRSAARAVDTARLLIRLNDQPANGQPFSEMEGWLRCYDQYYDHLKAKHKLTDSRGETAPSPAALRQAVSDVIDIAHLITRTGAERMNGDIALNAAERIASHIEFPPAILEGGDAAALTEETPAVSVIVHASHILSRDAMNDGPASAHKRENSIGTGFASEAQNLVFALHSLAEAAVHPGLEFKNSRLQIRQ